MLDWLSGRQFVVFIVVVQAHEVDVLPPRNCPQLAGLTQGPSLGVANSKPLVAHLGRAERPAQPLVSAAHAPPSFAMKRIVVDQSLKSCANPTPHCLQVAILSATHWTSQVNGEGDMTGMHAAICRLFGKLVQMRTQLFVGKAASNIVEYGWLRVSLASCI